MDFIALKSYIVMKQQKNAVLSYLSLNKIPEINNVQFGGNYMYPADLKTIQYTTQWIYMFHVK